MDDKPRCQSCGMPLDVGFFGTNADSTASRQYCKFCFENGSFKEPNLTLFEMMGRSAAKWIDDFSMDPDAAENLATTVIPTLKRWRTD